MRTKYNKINKQHTLLIFCNDNTFFKVDEREKTDGGRIGEPASCMTTCTSRYGKMHQTLL